MRTTLTAVFIVVVALLAAVLVRSQFTGEPDDAAAQPATADPGAAAPAASDPVAAELERLRREHSQLWDARDEAIPADYHQPTDMALSDDVWLQARRAAQASAPNPDTLLPQFVAFAQNHSTSPLAFDALFYVVSVTAFKEFRDEGKPWPVREQALELAWADHQDDPRLVHLLARLAVPSRQSESFLKRALANAPDRAVRAAAAFHLAEYYCMLAQCHKRILVVKDKPTLTNEDRFWKLVVAPNVEQHLPLNADENPERIEALLTQVVADYSDVPATDWRYSDSNRIFIKSVPFASPKTYGDLAVSLLDEMKNLVPGKPAPDIVGTDADGKSFRLSDYRGQVVLLTFSADWCPGCIKLYPLQRRLQVKFRGRPFVILSVSRDEKVDTLKSAIGSGQITWRCWWDGRYGPISDAWNVPGAPRIFLLDDQHIIQDTDFVFSGIGTEEEYKRAIAPLLENAAGRTEAALEKDGGIRSR